ncbi:N-formylglutamate amidohydrolase [Methylicorpusculum oleiharenae]|uniref:N-formylglutamate amidohydrolase n=1 Tax=Methylicorpusculum oleiharenae TaxID=1338687 RepID=UPI00135B7B6D|nr:N-formylglutamate amidohydrolase [Methylicorpusculum oleiharenae]MCD2450205.1 N-formylglutamate amidohydrolase [Methylicorpusculum oleiharenae]
MILHIPHSAIKFPDSIKFLKCIEEDLLRMTDWHTDDLFSHEASEIIMFKYSRLFCDVERFIVNEPMEEKGHGICYTIDSFGGPLRNISHEEREHILNHYYIPHHKELNKKCNLSLELYHKVVIVDCHSFSDEPLPHEFDQDVNRPHFCIGMNEFHTPVELINSIKNYLEKKEFITHVNNPFSGTIVPILHYNVTNNLKSIMIEVNRKLYLDRPAEEYSYINNIIYNVLDIIKKYEANS